VAKNQYILLSKTWLSSGEWGLIGGGLKINEDLISGIKREVMEETGFKLIPQKLTFIGDYRQTLINLGYNIKAYQYQVDRCFNLKRPTFEIAALRWFKINDLNKIKINKICAEIINSVLDIEI
jgi:8-oxo-dGTP pyrophosphatase MutT (NUDIX family)